VVEDRAAEYPQLARRALGDEPVGSSAAGEQPKFAVCQQDAGHVIVKFSPAADTADARRWKDLLRAEHHALALLREHDIPAAKTDLRLCGGRVFLESRRFDRCGARGRRPALSLDAVDVEFVGEGRSWTRVANKLRQRGLLDASSFEQIAWSQLFGAWIGNTDMHLGNISLSPTRDGFRLLPLYDMVPMAFAPVRGELLEIELEPPIRTALNEAFWAPAGDAATAYWHRLAEDAQLSDELRATALSHARRWKAILGR
jgi:serine/threonine protein kinase HipA of HipAB toxin-antitoxin module